MEEQKDQKAERDDESDPENPDEFKKSRFGTRKITAEVIQRYKEMRSEGNDLWNQLPELKYPVTKINQFGKRQPRTLKLSSVGIENIRKNGKVSSVHGYEQVKKVTMKNLKTFILKYEGAKHDYQYRSPVAMHIVQEITSRLSIKRQIQRTLPVPVGDIAQRHQEKLQQFGLLDRIPKKPSMRELPEEERKSYQAKKLQHLLGASEEQRLESAVDSIALDTSTTEGRTLKQFCNNFGVLEQNPATLVMNVRQFIDDLRGYIMEKHYKELSKLLVEASSKSFTPEDLSLSSVIERSLEKAIITRFHARILACLKQPSKEEEMTLRRNVLKAQEKSQEFFGIKPCFNSESNWADAVYELKLMNEFDLPSQQLGAILAAAKSIYGTFNWEKNKGKIKEQRKSYFLTADDFFPIFLYVVVHSDIQRPQVVPEYLWNLCDPEQLNGEGGYYLTVFCSALEYLKHAFDADNTASVSSDDPLELREQSPAPSPNREAEKDRGPDTISRAGHKRGIFLGGKTSGSAITEMYREKGSPSSPQHVQFHSAREPRVPSSSSLSSPSSSWSPSEGSLTPGSSFRLPHNMSSDCLSDSATPPMSPRDRKNSSKKKRLTRTSSLPSCRTSPDYENGGKSSAQSQVLSVSPRELQSSLSEDSDSFGARVNIVRTNSVMLIKNVAMGGVERLRRLRSGEVYRNESKGSASLTFESPSRDRITHHYDETETEVRSWRACKPHSHETDKDTFL